MIGTPDTRSARLETRGPALVVVVEHEGRVMVRSNARREEWSSLRAWISLDPRRAELYAIADSLAGPPGTRRPGTLAAMPNWPDTTTEQRPDFWPSPLGSAPGPWPMLEEGAGVRDDHDHP